MLPIVTVDPGTAGWHWFIASHVEVAPAGTTKVPEPVEAQATTRGLRLSPSWHVLTLPDVQVEYPPPIQLFTVW
jgi:hypothetical protein